MAGECSRPSPGFLCPACFPVPCHGFYLTCMRHGGNMYAEFRRLDRAGDWKRRSAGLKVPGQKELLEGLGQFREFRVVSEFRSLIENWHISDFHVADARPVAEDGYAEHLSTRGDNVAQVAQFLHDHHQDRFAAVLDAMKRRVPGISKVAAMQTVDGRLVLRFQDEAFKDPFIARFVSDGTIKMFAYLVLLHDPRPFPLLAVEEPENQLYPELLHELVEEFRDYANRGGQVFVSTHSPEFLNGLNLDEIYWLGKKDGYTKIYRAADSATLKALVAEGDLPGALWRQGIFKGAWQHGGAPRELMSGTSLSSTI